MKNSYRLLLLALIFTLSACAHAPQPDPSLTDPLPVPAPAEPLPPTPVIPAPTEPPAEIAPPEEPVVAEAPRYDIDFETNRQIDRWIGIYTRRGGSSFSYTLRRFDKVRPEMERIFEEYGLPKDLVYLSLIESGGTPHAVSHVGATGYWQFMAPTARHYGLRVDRWVDERRDLDKSTRAAARYLTHLHDIFDDWLLACAAYNAGEGTIRRIQRRHPEVNDFWDITPRMHIKRETLAYVPKFLAALTVATDRGRYHLPAEPAAPPARTWSTVEVNSFTHLDEIAAAGGTTLRTLTALNPELIRDCTPPGAKDYTLRVPDNCADKVANYIKLIHDPHVTYVSHTIVRGDTLYDLSRAHNTTVKNISEANRMDPRAVLTLGRIVVIPNNTEYDKPRRRHTYTVAPGDNLKSIAIAHNVTVQDLTEVNQLTNPNLIRPKDLLLIPPQRPDVASSGTRAILYRVKKGDTLWDISRQFAVSSKDLMRWNKLTAAGSIYPGDELTIYR